jgi:hypothetical protein
MFAGHDGVSFAAKGGRRVLFVDDPTPTCSVGAILPSCHQYFLTVDLVGVVPFMIQVVAFLISMCVVGEARRARALHHAQLVNLDPGLRSLDHILTRFKAASSIDVDMVAVGTGQALAIGARGDAAREGDRSPRPYQAGHYSQTRTR